MGCTRALLIGATAPHPVDSGKRVVLAGLLRYLAERLGPENVHFALVGGDTDDGPIPGFDGVLHRLRRPRTRAQLAGLARCLTDRSLTIQEAMLGGADLAEQITRVVDHVSADIEIYDTLRLGQHVVADSPASRRILYVDDLFSVRYERMLAVAGRGGFDMDPLGGFADHIPPRLRPLARQPFCYLPLLRFEQSRLRRRETEVVAHFDESLLVNADEVALLRERSGVDTIRTITPWIAPPKAVERIPANPPEFVFLGNLHLPHNDDAICSFLRLAGAELHRIMPGGRIRVVGRNAGPALQELAATVPGVSLEGFVDDLDGLLGRATAVLAPLRFGSGVKIKILESLARGLPVLATSVAMEGIPARPDGSDGCLVENDIAAWPGLLRGLAEGARAQELSVAASAFFARVYAAPVVRAEYDEIFALDPAGSAELGRSQTRQ